MNTFSSVAREVESIGKTLVKNRRDAWGRKWPFSTVPAHGSSGGSVCNYDSLDLVMKSIRDIQMIRGWEASMPPIGATP